MVSSGFLDCLMVIQKVLYGFNLAAIGKDLISRSHYIQAVSYNTHLPRAENYRRILKVI